MKDLDAMDKTEDNHSDDAIGALVRLAGRRPSVPQDAALRVRAAVHDEWQQSLGRRKRSRWLGAAAAAAVITTGALLISRPTSTSNPAPAVPSVVATVQSTAGGAIGGATATRHLLESGASILAGDSIETAEGAAASLSWGASTLRLDGGTRVRIASARDLRLERGAVYVASNPDARPRNSAIIRTPLGAVHDVGTQFEVRVASNGVSVRVREGRIELRQGSTVHGAKAGIGLDASASGAITEHAIARSGADWDWVVRAAPPMQLEGRTLSEVVATVTREEGITPVWADATSLAAASIRLHGKLALTPDEALDSALVASGLTAHVDGERLVIQRRK